MQTLEGHCCPRLRNSLVRIHRTILSSSVLFLAIGILIGDDVLGLAYMNPGSQSLTLFNSLFTDVWFAGQEGEQVSHERISDAMI